MINVSKYWLSNIVAMDNNGYIGKDNKLPWRLKNDMKEFKNSIKDSDLIMGRNTCESLPYKMNNKNHYVLTSDKNFHREGFITVNSLDELLSIIEKEKLYYVIGGSSIYKQIIKLAEDRNDVLLTNEVTVVDISIDGDSKFPEEDLIKYGYVRDQLSKNVDTYNGKEYEWKKYLYHRA